METLPYCFLFKNLALNEIFMHLDLTSYEVKKFRIDTSCRITMPKRTYEGTRAASAVVRGACAHESVRERARVCVRVCVFARLTMMIVLFAPIR